MSALWSKHVKLKYSLRLRKGGATSVAWSPDQRWLAATTDSGSPQVWSASSLEMTSSPRFTLSHEGAPKSTCLAWSSESKYLACGTATGDYQVLDTEQFRPLLKRPGRVSGSIKCVSWSPLADNTRSNKLAIGDTSHRVYFIESVKWKKSREEQGVGHISSVVSLAWSPDGQTVATGTEYGTIGLWRPFADGERLSADYRQELDSSALKPESLTYYGQTNGQGSLEIPLTSVLARFGIHAHHAEVASLAWSVDGQLASGSLDGSVVLWDTHRGNETASITLPEAVLSVRFVYADRILVVQTPDRILFLAGGSLETIWEQRYAALYDPGSPHRGPALDTGNGSLLALLSADDPTKIDVCYVDYSVLAAKAVGLHRSLRAVGVCLLGPSASGKTSLATAISGRPISSERTGHDLVVSSALVPSSPENLNEDRELVLWDPPSDELHNLVQDFHRSDCAISIITLRPIPGMGLTAHQNIDGWRHQLARYQGPRAASGASSLAVVTFVDEVRPQPRHEDIAALAESLHVRNVYLTNAPTGRGIAELREAVLQHIDWKTAICTESSELLDALLKFIRSRRDEGKCISTVAELREGFLRNNLSITDDMISDERIRTILQLLELKNEVYFFQDTLGVLLQPSYFREYAQAMVRAAEADPAGMGRLPLLEATTGTGRQIRLKRPVGLARAADHQEMLRFVVEEVVSAKLAQKVSTDGISYLVFPCSLTRTREISERPEAAARCKILGPVDEMFSALVVRLLGQSLHYPKSELWKNEASFTPATGGKCNVKTNPTSEKGNEADISVFFDSETTSIEKKKFLDLIQQHFGTYPNALSEPINILIEENSRPSPSTERPRVFLSWRTGSDMLTSANVNSIAHSLRADGLDVLDSEHPNLGWTNREKSLDFRQIGVAVILFSRAPAEDHVAEIAHLLKAGVRMIPVILPNAPRKGFSIPKDLIGWPSLDLRGRFLDTATLISGISRAWELGTIRPRNDRKGIFISYAHKDDKVWSNRLRTHFQWIESKGVPIWTDRDIRPGALWHESIQEALDRARVVVLMVSPDFLASSYIQSRELPKMLEASATDGLTIFWIPIKASAYRQSPIAKFQAAHPPDKPLAALSPSERDTALVAIGELLAHALDVQ